MTDAERRVNFIQAAAHLGRRLYLHYREQPAGKDFGRLVEEIERADAWHQSALSAARREALVEAAKYVQDTWEMFDGSEDEIADGILALKEKP
jgi:hypothetical protein